MVKNLLRKLTRKPPKEISKNSLRRILKKTSSQSPSIFKKTRTLWRTKSDSGVSLFATRI